MPADHLDHGLGTASALEATLPSGEHAEHRVDLQGVTGGMAPGMTITSPTMSMPMASPTSAVR